VHARYIGDALLFRVVHAQALRHGDALKGAREYPIDSCGTSVDIRPTKPNEWAMQQRATVQKNQYVITVLMSY